MIERERSADEAVSVVNELVEQRSRILGWLERLEESRDGESQRVVERVRADYEQRLQSVVRELSAHQESIQSDLSAARQRHQTAEDRFVAAEDALLEARLRHRIGELTVDAWEEKRGELEDAVTRAREDRDEAGSEVARLEEVLSQIESGEPSPPTASDQADGASHGEEAAPATDVATAAVFEMVELSRSADPAASQRAPFLADEDREEPDGIDQDLAFLEELDRAIAASSSVPDPGDGQDESEDLDEDEDAEGEILPGKGTKCTHCGYTNDAEAWYCGVCGVDLA